MTDYSALSAKWATLSGTTQQKLDAVNAATLPGPRVDVAISSVVGVLMLSGAYLPLATFAASAGNGAQPHDTALGAAKMLVALITTPNAPAINTSNPTNYAIVKGLMDAILAQETAVPGTTGFTQAVHDALLALADTTRKWWSVPIAEGGGGLSSAVAQPDLTTAGLS